MGCGVRELARAATASLSIMAAVGCATLPRTVAAVIESSERPYGEATRIDSRLVIRVIDVMRQPVSDARLRLVNLESKKMWQGWTNGAGEASFDVFAGSFSIELESKYGRAKIARLAVYDRRVMEVTIGILLAPELHAPDA